MFTSGAAGRYIVNVNNERAAWRQWRFGFRGLGLGVLGFGVLGLGL